MLVLSRHCEEAIMIGDDVEIVVVDIRGDKVRIGIEAPSTTPIHRREVYDAENDAEDDDDVDPLTLVGRAMRAG